MHLFVYLFLSIHPKHVFMKKQGSKHEVRGPPLFLVVHTSPYNCQLQLLDFKGKIAMRKGLFGLVVLHIIIRWHDLTYT